MFKSFTRARRYAIPVGAILALLVGILGAPPANAAPSAPGGLAPRSTSTSATPALTWWRVAGADRYEVQLASTPSFASPLLSSVTVNRRIVPTGVLPSGTLYWRVRAVTASGAAGGWGSASFTVTATAPPRATSPANGAVLTQPTNPPLLTWTAVAGATSYQVDLDTDSDFVGATGYTTKSTSLVVPEPKTGGTYWWRVRAQRGNGIFTQPSVASTYKIGELPAVTTTSPANGEETVVQDVVLKWDPVAGAKTYEVLVSTDSDFNTIVDQREVKGTRYSRPDTYLNNQYWWKVRAKNNNTPGETIPWTQVPFHIFKRQWPDRPQLMYPEDGFSAVTRDPFFFQWKPIPHATRYQLDVGRDQNFSQQGVTYQTCYTALTTYAAGYLENPGDACMPSQGGVYYWRVRALDDPSQVQGIFSTIQSFVYDSGGANQTWPADNATVAVPTLKWQESRDAEKYKVIIENASGQVAAQTDTYSLSWTPTGTSKLDPAKGPFKWTVQTIDANGSLSPRDSGRRFSIAGEATTTGALALTPLTGVTGDPATVRFPILTWEPKDGAAYYRLKIGISGSGFWLPTSQSPILTQSFPYNAATDTGAGLLNPGTYDWQAEAFNSSNVSLGTGPLGTFKIEDLAPVTGQQLALSGTSLKNQQACTSALDATAGTPDKCTNVPTTPVLSWDPVPGAALYKVYLAQDRELTNLVYTSIPLTSNTMWTPTWSSSPKTLADSQAGKAYYWFVRPCKTKSVCAPDPVSTDKAAKHAFDKRSPATVLQNTEDTENDITFSWQDYLQTNRATTYLPSGEVSDQTAKQYRVQVSTTSTFATTLDDRLVDQTTYTAFDRTYPEGLLWWRVQAVDGQGNGLTWSAPRSFLKRSPAPKLLAPAGDTVTSGTTPFRWDPTDFAGSYLIEVYKDNDTAWSPSNRVVSYTSKQTAYAHSTPLPASSLPYVWRVARLDADARPGAWSTTGRFYSRGAAPALLTPSNGLWLKRNDGYFAWSAVPGAVSYRFERKASGSSWTSESVTTNALAWAPTSAISDGTGQWRVTALDVNQNVLGSSSWRTFYVDSTPPTVVSKSPTSYGVARRTNFVAKFSEPVKNVNGTTVRLFVKGKRLKLAARVTLSSDGKKATLNPNVNLRAGKTYTVKLSGSITDRRGNRLVATSWSVVAR